jgi:hypothetical protein
MSCISLEFLSRAAALINSSNTSHGWRRPAHRIEFGDLLGSGSNRARLGDRLYRVNRGPQPHPSFIEVFRDAALDDRHWGVEGAGENGTEVTHITSVAINDQRPKRALSDAQLAELASPATLVAGDAPSTPGRPLRDVLEPDRRSSRGHSLRHLHVRVRDREPPGLQLARPRSEVVLRDAHHLHRNDLRNVLFELHLIDDALDRYIAPVVGRLGE